MTEVKVDLKAVEDAQAKAKDAEKKLIASFAQKMCPVLSIGALSQAPAPSPLVSVPGQAAQRPEPEVMGCQGPACQWFVATTADDAGNVTGGGCVIALIPSATLQLRDANIGIANSFIGNYKIVPRK